MAAYSWNLICSALSVIGALLLLIASTLVQKSRQVRLAVWLAGVALLILSGLLLLRNERIDDIVLSELWRHDPSGASLRMALIRNFAVIRDYVSPLVAVMIVLGCGASLAALYAFTPGYRVERATRVISASLLGAIMGSAITLAFVAVGYGSYPPRVVYFGTSKEINIVDGDTFDFGHVRVRPKGVDAPETKQRCLKNGTWEACGEAAKNFIATITGSGLVVCERSESEKDPYGRVLATCRVFSPDGPKDLALALVQAGYAIASDDNSDHLYSEAANRASLTQVGLWGTCALRPSIWRGDRTAREEFSESPLTGWREEDVISVRACQREANITAAASSN